MNDQSTGTRSVTSGSGVKGVTSYNCQYLVKSEEKLAGVLWL